MRFLARLFSRRTDQQYFLTNTRRLVGLESRAHLIGIHTLQQSEHQINRLRVFER